MVDALAAHFAPDEHLEITVVNADRQACETYRGFAGPRVKGSAQHPLWYETWLAQSKERGHIVWISRGGSPVAALPLVERRINGMAALSFAGDRHANGNFCPHADIGTALGWDELSRSIKAALPHIALISLERQHKTIAGQINFLSDMATRTSPNIALAVSLDGGFAAVLESANGKKKNSKRRMQARRFEEAGGGQVRKNGTADQIREVLDIFFELKRARFEKAGITDVFGAPHVRRFWQELIIASQREPDHPFSVEALIVGDTILAVTGSSHLRDRTICEFGGIADDKLSSISPGEYLAYSNIEEACSKGLAFYDFSVGDEAYKRSWCRDKEITHFDVVIPLTTMGRLALVGSNALSAAKQRVKSNPTLWNAAKALRRLR